MIDINIDTFIGLHKLHINQLFNTLISYKTIKQIMIFKGQCELKKMLPQSEARNVFFLL